MFIVPFNVLLVSIVSALFLLLPVRQTQGAKRLDAMGAQLLTMLIQGMVVLAVGLICGVPMGLVYWLTSSFFFAGLVAWGLLTICALAGVYVTGMLFSKFDVTKIP